MTLGTGRSLLRYAAKGLVVVACDHDVDGLASGVLVACTVERTSGTGACAAPG
jgi:hypothetical protein